MINIASASLPVRGAWIEIAETQPGGLILRSLPVRGAWIEIARQTAFGGTACGRSPCGERGLKFLAGSHVPDIRARRSPCGERGLKCGVAQMVLAARLSLPVRGAWIEIFCANPEGVPGQVAPRAGSVD